MPNFVIATILQQGFDTITFENAIDFVQMRTTKVYRVGTCLYVKMVMGLIKLDLNFSPNVCYFDIHNCILSYLPLSYFFNKSVFQTYCKMLIF